MFVGSVYSAVNKTHNDIQTYITHPSAVFFPKRPKLTSNTVFSKPMFAPWYRPTWCSHRLTIRTSEDARENNADLRSKSCVMC